MFFEGTPSNAFKLIMLNPVKYGINIRPIRDCVTTSKEWHDMAWIIARIYQEYNHAIPMPILVEVFMDTFSDVSILDEHGEIMCKLEYNWPE